MEIMNSSWKDRLKVNYTYNTIGSGEDLISFIENLLEKERKETEQRVLEDCIETILGCDENCAECEADNPHQDLWCPYKEKLSKLKEKYL
jgi:hypothetical protein